MCMGIGFMRCVVDLGATCRVYPNSTAEHETQNTLAHADGRSGPVTVSFDAMALALELAALRSAGERASRREFALVRSPLPAWLLSHC